MNKLLIFLMLGTFGVFGQSYAPAPGQPGSTAIHMDSSIIVDWASDVVVTRGPMNILNTAAGLASYGVDADAVGPADGISAVSLGDSGIAIVTFNSPILNGPGPDFAIFENGFIDHYMELGFVEVSSDGVNYFRFDAVSEIPADTQLTNFSTSNCGYVHNLAGKYRAEYGTPFDLEELTGIAGLDVNNVQFVRIIDVIGSIDTLVGSFDSQANIINDPFPTEFESGGFDLEAVGVIHSFLGLEEEAFIKVNVFPNPSSGLYRITSSNGFSFMVHSTDGQLVSSGTGSEINITSEKNGIYFLSIISGDQILHQMLVKE